MKFKIKKIILSVVNLICLAGIIFLNILSNNQINALTSQRGAEKWGSDCSQISCFFSDDSGMTENSVNAIRNTIKTAMADISLTEKENARLWIDTYSSSVGKFEVSGTKRGTAKTEITAVTSDFFLIHDFNFIDGSYFREEELSENGIVIDRSLAWQIFGSDEVTGMTAVINNTDFYVAGIVDIPQCSAETKTYGSIPRAYISYDAIELISEKNIAINCYEAVIPNPVENYAYSIISEFINEQYENTSYTIDNTSRFSLSNNFERLKHLSDSVIVENSVAYTWWENSARVTEVKVSINLFAILVLLIIPLLTLLWICVKLFKYIKSKYILKGVLKRIKEKTSI